MSSASSVIDEARALLEKSLAEIDKERERVQRALGELGGRAPRRGPGRPPGSRNGSGSSSSSRRRRRRRGGTRGDQAVKLVEASPGISASEIATEMKIKPNYLYRVLADLEKEGRVRKDGRKYHPAATSTT